MTIDKLSSPINTEIKSWVSIDDLDKSQSNIELSQKLTKVNNVLGIINLPENKEESFRELLNKQDLITLDNLALKSKKEILLFWLKEKRASTDKKVKTALNTEKEENIKQIKELEKVDWKLLQIKAIFTEDILNKNPDISDKFTTLDSLIDPVAKEKVLNELLQILKAPWKLKSIIDDIWWVDKNNPKYIEFKNSLIELDSSFKSYFDDYESISSWKSLDTSEIIDNIEKGSGAIVDIDLKSEMPVSKLRLIWSEYSFDEEIDKNELYNIMWNNKNKLSDVQNSYTVLKGVYTPFDTLLSQIRSNWSKQDFKENLRSAINDFPTSIFSNLDEVYTNIWIDSSIQIRESDVLSLSSVNSPEELKSQIELIKFKILMTREYIDNMHNEIVINHRKDITELLKRKSEDKEKQIDVLKFMKNSWFDLIPKDITNKIIEELKSNMLLIPWLNLSISNIDLKNGHFWESSAFIDKNWWINTQSKMNIIRFINKIISWDVNEPLWVEAISNGTSVADPQFLKGKFEELWIVDNLGWKYNKIISNLKNNPIK